MRSWEAAPWFLRWGGCSVRRSWGCRVGGGGGWGGVREAGRWLRSNGWDGFGILGLVVLK